MIWSFFSLCSSSTPLSRFVFGDEVSKSVKDITRANKIMAKAMHKKGKTSSDDKQDKRPFCGTALPYQAAVITTTASTRESSPEGSQPSR